MRRVVHGRRGRGEAWYSDGGERGWGKKEEGVQGTMRRVWSSVGGGSRQERFINKPTMDDECVGGVVWL